MPTFAQVHANSLRAFDLWAASVTFTLQSPGTYDATTDTWSSGSAATVVGKAYRVTGDPKVYAGLELIEADAPTLLFRPTTYAQVPALNSTCSWNSTTYTVKHVSVVSPDGSAILARVVVAV